MHIHRLGGSFGFFAKPQYQGDFALADNPQTPPEVLVDLADKKDELIDHLLLMNWNCPSEALRKVRSRHPEWTDEISNHYNAPRELRLLLTLSMLNVSHVERFLEEEQATHQERLLLHRLHKSLVYGQGPSLGAAWRSIRSE